MTEQPKKIKRDDGRMIVWVLNYSVMRRPESSMGPGCKWSPLTNLVDAWDLVGALSRPEEDHLLNLSMCTDGTWTANFSGDDCREYAMTVPRAICYAALRVIGIELIDA